MRRSLLLTLLLLLACVFAISGCSEGEPTSSGCQHTFCDWVLLEQPTCAKDGKLSRTCSKCFETEESTVPKSSIHTEVIDAAIAPTCTETGMTEGSHCSVCDDVLVKQEEAQARGHSFGEWTQTKATTCVEDGTLTRTCSECFGIEESTVPKSGIHTIVVDAAVAPTCMSPGITEGSHCSVCGETLVAQNIIDALGHTEVVDKAVSPTCTKTGLTEGMRCLTCHETLVAQKVVSATGHKSNASATCTSDQICYVCHEIVVKAKGHNYTFAANDIMASPSVILTHSCSYCHDSYTETITPTDFTITHTNRGMVGFTGKYNETLVIPAIFNNNGTWYRVKKIGAAAFKDCTYLKSVTIPDSVESIGDNAFYWCLDLSSISLSNNLKSIGEWAFGSTAITSIKIPDSVTSIGDLAFISCGELKSITIPDGVTSISSSLFTWCSGLTTITIPKTITSLGSYAFNCCENLSSIVIPESVTSIGYGAFRNCISLTSVKFDGTVAQWNIIEFGPEWMENVLATKVICTDGEVAL